MPKLARVYEIYLPLTYNDGRRIERAKWHALEHQLMEQFGGLTSHRDVAPKRGLWREGTTVYVDQINILTVLDERPRGSARFITQLKSQLLEQFEQKKILIMEIPVRLH